MNHISPIHLKLTLRLRLGNHQIVRSRIPALLEVNPICWHLRDPMSFVEHAFRLLKAINYYYHYY